MQVSVTRKIRAVFHDAYMQRQANFSLVSEEFIARFTDKHVTATVNILQ